MCNSNIKTNFSASKKRQKTILAKAVALALLAGSVVPATGWAATISGVKFVDDNRTGGERQTIAGTLEPLFTGGGGIYLKLDSAPADQPPAVEWADFADGSYSFTGISPGTYKIWQYVNPTSPLFALMSSSPPDYFASETNAKIITIASDADAIPQDFPVPNLTPSAATYIADAQTVANAICNSAGSNVVPVNGNTWPTGLNEDSIVIISSSSVVEIPDPTSEIHVQAVCNYGILRDNDHDGLTITYDALFANFESGRVEGIDGSTSLPFGSGVNLEIYDEFTPCPLSFDNEHGSCEYYGLFYNEGIIQAGDGLHRSHTDTRDIAPTNFHNYMGGNGGLVNIYGNRVVQNGTLQGGNGGDVDFTESYYWEYSTSDDLKVGGDGGAITINSGGVITGSSLSITMSGEGGDVGVTNPCVDMPSPSDCHGYELIGGDSGALEVGGQELLPAGHYKGQSIWVDPTVSFMGSDTTLIAEQDVVIFGGDNWLLELRGLNPEAITAGNKIILATGPGGTIDLRGNNANIFKAGVQVEIYTDNLLLDDGVTIESLVDAPNGVIVSSARIIYHAVITGSSQLSGNPNETLPLHLDLRNAGPDVDTYTLAISSENGWTVSGLPTTLTIEGLERSELALNVTLPATGNDIITITATSGADSTVVATTEIRVGVEGSEEVEEVVEPSVCANAEYVVDENLIRVPSLGIPLLDPFTQKSTGEVVLASVDLSLLDGTEDFQIIPDSLVVTNTIVETSDCRSVYNYDGTLHIPNIDIQEVIMLPPNIIVGSVTRTYEVTLKQLTLTPDVFHLEEYTLLSSGTGGTGTGGTGTGGTGTGGTGTGEDDPPAAECSLEEQAQLMEPFVLYQAVMPMVVVENDIMGEWPNPLSSVITPPTGVYTAGLETHDPFHIDATMKTEDEGVAACFAGKTIHFIFDPSARTWGCNTDIPAEYMTLFPMSCTQ
jgi:hypothetical protein